MRTVTVLGLRFVCGFYFYRVVGKRRRQDNDTSYLSGTVSRDARYCLQTSMFNGKRGEVVPRYVYSCLCLCVYVCVWKSVGLYVFVKLSLDRRQKYCQISGFIRYTPSVTSNHCSLHFVRNFMNSRSG